MSENIQQSWKTILETEFEKPYFLKLSKQINQAYRDRTIYPSSKNIFNAFTFCPFDEIKVVILGQDPYHGANQAHGLAFSVPDEVKIPPSLRNIYKEIASDIGTKIPETGNLEHWAHQGVLLLNATLTVEAENAGSHQGLGWETFTDSIIETISREKEHVVFLLWGNFAQSKASLIDKTKHLVLQAPHPSPLSAHRGFLGCKHFSQTNGYLKRHKIQEIKW